MTICCKTGVPENTLPAILLKLETFFAVDLISNTILTWFLRHLNIMAILGFFYQISYNSAGAYFANISYKPPHNYFLFLPAFIDHGLRIIISFDL